MSVIDLWAKWWGIPPEAVNDLYQRYFQSEHRVDPSVSIGETAIQKHHQISASKAGWRLWRNNRGAAYNAQGGFVRYGLCNESEAVSKRFKSSDLIGIRPVRIVPELVGSVIGQFVSVEVKTPGWSLSPADKHAGAQLHWGQLVESLGGHFYFTTSKEVHHG